MQKITYQLKPLYRGLPHILVKGFVVEFDSDYFIKDPEKFPEAVFKAIGKYLIKTLHIEETTTVQITTTEATTTTTVHVTTTGATTTEIPVVQKEEEEEETTTTTKKPRKKSTTTTTTIQIEGD